MHLPRQTVTPACLPRVRGSFPTMRAMLPFGAMVPAGRSPAPVRITAWRNCSYLAETTRRDGTHPDHRGEKHVSLVRCVRLRRRYAAHDVSRILSCISTAKYITFIARTMHFFLFVLLILHVRSVSTPQI